MQQRHAGFLAIVTGTLVLLVSALAHPTQAARVLPLNLEQLTERADRVFSARCVSAAPEFDPAVGREVEVLTFEVIRGVKGQLGATVQIRTLSADSFEPGEEVVLFLYGESASGLTSPVGLGQGKFKVAEDKHGRKVATNGSRNRDLLELSPTDLLDRVESLLARARR